MAGDAERPRWTVLLLRDDGVRAGSWSFGPTAAVVLGGGAAVLLVACGVAIGLWWAGARADGRVAELRAEVGDLRTERARVRRLAARLDSIERDYGRLRRAVTRGADDSARTVRLPPVAESREEADRGERRERWRWPLARRGFVTRSFDAAGSTGHPGLDVAVPSGSYVRASRPGLVAEAGTDSVYGRFVRIRHEDGASSLYGHAEWLFVATGDSVEGGQVIALSGSTGRSSAPHLHFEVRREGRSVDPARLLRAGTGGPGQRRRGNGGAP